MALVIKSGKSHHFIGKSHHFLWWPVTEIYVEF